MSHAPAPTVPYEGIQALPRQAGTVDRRRLLVEEAADRRVVHLGCVDDRLTEQRLDAGVLLHAQLAAVAKELVGVDISAAGIDLLRDQLPGAYVVGDVQDLGSVSLPEEVDVVIASELIEHLPSPGLFLDGLRELLHRTGAHAVITTPNAYGWVSFVRLALRRQEATHPDHVLVYTPYTFVHALEQHGLTVEALHLHDWERPKGLVNRMRSAVAAVVRRWNPYLAPGLIARVSVR